jgi:hypothetical protein
MNKKEKTILENQLVFNLRWCFEDLHAGKSIVSEKGDFSDVKVVTSNGEIPWNEVSKISQKQMAELKIEMREVIKKSIDFFLKNKEDLVRVEKKMKELKLL